MVRWLRAHTLEGPQAPVPCIYRLRLDTSSSSSSKAITAVLGLQRRMVSGSSNSGIRTQPNRHSNPIGKQMLLTVKRRVVIMLARSRHLMGSSNSSSNLAIINGALAPRTDPGGTDRCMVDYAGL